MTVNLIRQKSVEDSVIFIAPTAAAAVNAGERTIHSALRIVVVFTGRCTEKERKIMTSRFINEMLTNEKEKFKNSIRICSIKESANEFNIQKLKMLRKPIPTIKADNNSKTAFLSSDE
ncbi:hypothetical protein FOCC_FOCC013419 [Frankliniella occidentalis]|nr:hypothetical protein FOCC_FOCC013419 [Frankliniella occidentalis]